MDDVDNLYYCTTIQGVSSWVGRTEYLAWKEKNLFGKLELSELSFDKVGSSLDLLTELAKRLNSAIIFQYFTYSEFLIQTDSDKWSWVSQTEEDLAKEFDSVCYFKFYHSSLGGDQTLLGYSLPVMLEEVKNLLNFFSVKCESVLCHDTEV